MPENKSLQKDTAAQQGIGVRQLRNRNHKKVSIGAIHEKLKAFPDLQAFFDDLAITEDGKNRKHGISKDEFRSLSELPVDELVNIIEKLRESKGNFKAVLRETLPEHESKTNVILPAYVNQWFNEVSKVSGVSKSEILSKIVIGFFQQNITFNDVSVILRQAGIVLDWNNEDTISPEKEFETILNIINKSTKEYFMRRALSYANKREARKEYNRRKKEFIEKYGYKWEEKFKEYE